jgi:hypothetical protein
MFSAVYFQTIDRNQIQFIKRKKLILLREKFPNSNDLRIDLHGYTLATFLDTEIILILKLTIFFLIDNQIFTEHLSIKQLNILVNNPKHQKSA